jgi:hypothetical protein
MHAHVVLQHYLAAMQSTDPVPMLDMAVDMKKYVPAGLMERRIWLFLTTKVAVLDHSWRTYWPKNRG